MADRVGQQLDNYRLTRLLGAGGFGEVYLAEHLYRTTQVAIKLLPQLAQDDLHSFLIEARTFRLKHPNIVQVLDFGVEGRIPFIVMEYAPNGTLRQRYPKGTRVLLPTIVSYVKQVASALQYAHDERLVHRDVKPENMLIGVQNQVLLSDFGIATIAHGTASQSVEAMAGTIPYMAPEQIQGHPRSASDQYSLGVVVYEWLCGDRPFHGTLTEVAVQHATVPPPLLREKVPTISPDVEQVVTTALAKDPKQRFGSVLAFATALEQASQVKQSEPELEPVVPVSETTDTNQSQQPTEMATPVPIIPFSQQAISEVSADTSVQPHTIIPSPGEERQRQIEEVRRRQAEEERASQAQEQADKIEEERVRKAKETALAATELAIAAHQTPLPTEVARSSKPPALRPDAAQRRAVRRKRTIWISVIAAVVVLASAITAIALANAPKSTTQNHSALATEAVSNPAYPPVDGVYCDQLEQTAYHIHVHLTIWLNGSPVTVPQNVGIASDTSCFYWLHTHDTTGVVHIEAPATASLNLQQFLHIWGKEFSTLGYQDQLASSTGWTVWVDGKQISGGFSKVAFQPHMVITIAYNSPNVKPDTVYNFAPGL